MLLPDLDKLNKQMEQMNERLAHIELMLDISSSLLGVIAKTCNSAGTDSVLEALKSKYKDKEK